MRDRGGKSRREPGFAADSRGSIVVAFALLLPVVVMLIGGAIDFGGAINAKFRLQSAIDKAALTAARELGLSDARRENVPEAVERMVLASMRPSLEQANSLVLETVVRDEPLEVRVVARQTSSPTFVGFGSSSLEFELHAVARIVGRPNICLLALEPSGVGALSLEKQARITGQNCAVFSNSTHTNSIKSKNSAILTASLICSAGGKDGLNGNFVPEPLTDCPTFDDPLADRAEPLVGACNSALPSRVNSSRSLPPGTYCGGLEISGGAEVTLEPGIYVIKNGPLLVRDDAVLKGTDVGFYLTGNDARTRFDRRSSIDLSAARSGAMAGLLFFGARNQTKNVTHEILSDDARNLLGTLYFPSGRLHVDANNPIADRSAYTAIVARMVTLYGGPHLILNANYDQTDVPVPHGIRGAAQPVKLVE